jgi:large subunit ribosomal protein L13
LHPQIGDIVLFKNRKVVDTLSYKTVSGNKETANKKWLLVDAEGQTVGRLASKVAKLIRGKHKTNYTPHADCGDNVIVINAAKISFSGTKLVNKEYIRYTGYPGGQRSLTAQELLARNPQRVVEKAIKGMLPKNTLGRNLFTNLKVYAGAEHKQEAQNPEVINLDTFK